MITLSEIRVYPVKSLAGISLAEARLELRGLEYDRRWMLVDDQGRFVTQRELPEMALLGVRIEAEHLTVFSRNHPGDCITVPFSDGGDHKRKLRVQIWSSNCTGIEASSDINNWFSNILKYPLRLVRMPAPTKRAVDGRYAPPGQFVSFADGFPYLLIGQASLDDLNGRLAVSVPMNRFRPNFVCTGTRPFEEDTWSGFSIGSWNFKAIKPCARCIIPTIDQDNPSPGIEPLKTLASYRRSGNKVHFGQNLIWVDPPLPQSRIRVGDLIRIH